MFGRRPAGFEGAGTSIVAGIGAGKIGLVGRRSASCHRPPRRAWRAQEWPPALYGGALLCSSEDGRAAMRSTYCEETRNNGLCRDLQALSRLAFPGRGAHCAHKLNPLRPFCARAAGRRRWRFRGFLKILSALPCPPREAVIEEPAPSPSAPGPRKYNHRLPTKQAGGAR